MKKEKNLPYAIIRSRDQGVMAGYVKSYKGQQVMLERARQVWSYDSFFTLIELAEYGPRNPEACKFSCELSQEMIMLEACGIIYCTEKASKKLQALPATKRE